jgi:two-component system sensor histidine kinase UhpB
MKLKTQLLFAISTLMLLVLMLGAVATYLRAVSKVSAEMRAAIEVGSRIARNAVDDVEEASDPKRRIELLVADFNGDRHLRALLVTGPGRVAMASELAVPDEDVPRWFVKLFGGEARNVHLKLPKVFEGLGDFVLQTDSRNEVAELWNEVVVTLALLVTFCVLSLVVVHMTLERALQPLGRLSLALSKVGSMASVEHVDEIGPSELSAVYKGFNRMVDRLHQVEQQNGRLNDQLATVQEEERADIARDLHDEIGPFLFAVDVDAATIQRAMARRDLQAVAPHVDQIRESVGHMNRHLKAILARLRPSALIDLGLDQAVEHLVGFWRSRNSDIVFGATVAASQIEAPMDAIAYRVVQEGLSNAVRHGKPSRVDVNVEQSGDGTVTVRIEDDGCGLGGSVPGGYGLLGMRERLAAHGGTLEVGSGRKGGTVLVARLPASIRAPAALTSKLSNRVAAE